jgi:hypothetical protein
MVRFEQLKTRLATEREQTPPAVLGTDVFTRLYVVLCIWLVSGAYIDSWAHHHLTRLETFFTPWHAVLYASIFAITLFLAANWWLNFQRGYSMLTALPPAYFAALIGSILFGAGGFLDMLWHLAFGIELSIAALLSPTHLLLMVSGGLMVSAPLLSAMRSSQRTAPWTAVVSAALTVSLLTFFAQFDHPFVETWAAGSAPSPRGPSWMEEELGLLGLILYVLAVMALVLALVRRFRLRPGTLTLIFGVNGAFLSPIADQWLMLPVAIGAGLAGDLLLLLTRPSPHHPLRFRAFAFAVPMVFTAVYFLSLYLTAGVWWPVHLWAGAAPLAGGVGWLLSFMVVPSPHGAARQHRPQEHHR